MPITIRKRILIAAALTSIAMVVMSARPATCQIDPHTAFLEQAGWRALDAGSGEAAANAFREAIVADPKNPRLHLGAAAAAYLQRRDTEASAALNRALTLDPKLPGARELLGRVLYRSGDIDGAIRTFEVLVREGGRGPSLADTLNRWRREAELRDRMNVAFGSGVTVSFEGPDDTEQAQRAVASLERASARIGAALSYYPTAPIAVVLYTNEQFRDITRSPSWAAGAFDGKIRVPIGGAFTNLDDLDRVLAHEYTHALVHDLARSGVPTWLNEGLASAFEIDRPGVSQPSVAVPLRALEESFRVLTDSEARQAYGFSAFAVQRLLDESGGFAMTNLLRDIGNGVDFDTAFTHRMQRTFSDFEASLTKP